jgi:hypothetical protein
MADHLTDPEAISWDELKDELGFSDAELEETRTGAQELIARAHLGSLADLPGA